MNFGYFWRFWRIFFGYTGISLPPPHPPPRPTLNGKHPWFHLIDHFVFLQSLPLSTGSQTSVPRSPLPVRFCNFRAHCFLDLPQVALTRFYSTKAEKRTEAAEHWTKDFFESQAVSLPCFHEIRNNLDISVHYSKSKHLSSPLRFTSAIVKKRCPFVFHLDNISRGFCL